MQSANQKDYKVQLTKILQNVNHQILNFKVGLYNNFFFALNLKMYFTVYLVL